MKNLQATFQATFIAVTIVVIAMAMKAVPVFAQDNAALSLIQPARDEWQGPLPVENERPFQSIFLHLPAQNPDVLKRGQTRYGVQLDIANDLLIPLVGPNGATVVEDFETQRLKVSWSKGFGRGLEYGVGTNLTARNGGFLDSTIEAVHNVFDTEGDGFDHGGLKRENIPRNRSLLSFQNAAGQGVNQGNAFGLGDTTLWLKKQISQNRKFSSAASVALKLPTGSESKILGSGSFDGGVAVDARYAIARKFALFGNLGIAKYGNSSIPGAANNGAWGAVGYEWKIGRRDSIIGQINYQKRAVTTDNAFADRRPVIGSFGYKKQVSPNRAYWLAIGENGDLRNYKLPEIFNIGPDIALSFGYEFKH